MTSRSFTVAAPDGALLRVQEHLPTEAADSPTVVLAHGWTLTHASWQPVVDRLVATGTRVVTYDQRGHGVSSPLRGETTVRMLGDDLAAVLDVVAPHGPVVLGGHSMGGMSVMACAGLHRDDFRSRVVGVVLVATSADDLQNRLGVVEGRLLRLAARMPRIPAGRFVTTRGQRRLLFGIDPDPAQVQLTRDMVAATSLPTMGRFFGALGEHDESDALEALDGIPTLVLVGDRDRLTPPRHSHRLAELVPHAELRLLPGRGHMLMYEATDEVVDALQSALAASTTRRG
ncbi:Lysophospholipase, alpha-beta hydrolase superfamily [Pedococcus dokdonensis]|uniref:Lysophospholipase, alpha-beta hydrolase superfamily n=1 Tax=Pedococcus dokdonensis TaxID=443156 RepID=A0A1H0T6C2_9MICO|nr:alpha/beta hydrolase [Pedococcus dokdonensis]SDP49300.1 Lysophospholipase, alpha-beta hydrolase superfamily [Pedococcus dokdonensis]